MHNMVGLVSRPAQSPTPCPPAVHTTVGHRSRLPATTVSHRLLCMTPEHPPGVPASTSQTVVQCVFCSRRSIAYIHVTGWLQVIEQAQCGMCIL